MLKMTETIVKFGVSDKSKENAWSDLVIDIVDQGISGDAHNTRTYLKSAEEEYMEQFHSENPAAKTKAGRWKTSKYLPNAYKSAKSVIIRAAQSGATIAVKDHVLGIVPRGKTEVERDIQGRKLFTVQDTTDKLVRRLAAWREMLKHTYHNPALAAENDLAILYLDNKVREEILGEK